MTKIGAKGAKQVGCTLDRRRPGMPIYVVLKAAVSQGRQQVNGDPGQTKMYC